MQLFGAVYYSESGCSNLSLRVKSLKTLVVFSMLFKVFIIFLVCVGESLSVWVKS